MNDRIGTSEQAMWVVDALATQVQQLRQALDHRSIFSMGYNRKLARKIELLDQIREDYLMLARDLHRAAQEDRRNE